MRTLGSLRIGGPVDSEGGWRGLSPPQNPESSTFRGELWLKSKLTVPGVPIQLKGVREKLHELAQTQPKHAFYVAPRPVGGVLAPLTEGGAAPRSSYGRQEEDVGG